LENVIDDRLNKLNISLPEANTPLANYVPYVITGNHLYISGQIPMLDGKPSFIGTLGRDISTDDGNKAARLCGLSIIAIAKEALGGNLDLIVRCVKLVGYVASLVDYQDQPKVINGASDLMVEVFGEEGRHARAAVGVSSLPLNVSVEVEAIFEIK
jgi:enamine deaminase RidA (YjgF/YER057c/UK114 family)|tara:strand:+ start:636 stop:1103 length:468 start_codon:yes stop_codon:yes gene_type:complete